MNPLKPASLFLFIIVIAISNQLDKSVDPCEDFYSYACGGFFKEHKLSNKEGEITSFSIAIKENLKVLRHALENDTRYSQVETLLILSCSSVFSRHFRKRPPREFEKVVATRAGRSSWSFTRRVLLSDQNYKQLRKAKRVWNFVNS